MSKEVFEATYTEEIFLVKSKPIVVINKSWVALKENERELLTKIITALKISLDAITLVSSTNLQITNFHGKTEKLIYFGDLPAGVAYYEVLQSGNLSFICAESISELINNEAGRKQLWVGLRRLFSI